MSTGVLHVGEEHLSMSFCSSKVRGFLALGKTLFPGNLVKTVMLRREEHQCCSAGVLLACSVQSCPAGLSLKHKYLFRGQLNGCRALSVNYSCQE